MGDPVADHLASDASTSPALLVMHALRIKGLAGEDVLSRMTGLASADVTAEATDLTESDLAVVRTGRFAGWALTPKGRERYGDLLAEERQKVGANSDLRTAYDQFVSLNEGFKTVCTAWQVRDLDTQLLNDHTDPAYDIEVIGRLGAIHDEVLPVIGQLRGVLSRFGGYRDRLADSYRRVQAGDRDAFTRPMSESYHDVWMELHEDLLLTLNISRDSAGA
jgi:hypothetical protein